MNVLAGACAGGALAGAFLVAQGVRGLRPDPVARGLGDRAPRPAGTWVDGVLELWDRHIARHSRDSRLRVLGLSVRAYRTRQTAAVAVALAGVLTLAALAGGGFGSIIWVFAAGPAALLITERWLRGAAARVRAQVCLQVLAATEHLAICVTAGETVAEAIGRTADQTRDPLRGWLVSARAQISSGRAMDRVLQEIAEGLQVPEFTRLVDTVVSASHRGTPLAATLVSQVADSRSRRRALAMERAGRAEIAMLLPIVFLILPCVVAVALFPGAVQLLSM